MKMRRRTLEIAVGAVIVVVAAAFLVIAFTGGGIGAQPGYDVTARFRQADGLGVGSPVHLAGIKIGEVSGLVYDSKIDRVVVTMRITEPVQLSEDSAAQVVTDGLLGAKFIRIDPGGAEATIPPGGRFIHVQDALNIERLLEKIIANAEQERRARAADPKRCRCGDAPPGR